MGSASQEEDMEVGQEEGWGRGHSQGVGAQGRGAGGVAVSKGTSRGEPGQAHHICGCQRLDAWCLFYPCI